MALSENDLQKMGLKANPDGSYSKVKTSLQPRESRYVNENKPMRSSSPLRVTKEYPIEPYITEKKRDLVYFNHMDIQDVYAQCEKDNCIFIPRNVPSLKNSKQLFKSKNTRKTFITSSQLCKDYVKETDIHWKIFKPRFLELISKKKKPYTIQFFFIRDKHKKFDYNNVSQICLDLMQKHGWIENDSCDDVIPNYEKQYGYDPKLPGVIIRVL